MARTSLWWRAPLLGAAIGLPVLGIGGRVAMRVIAQEASAAPLLTFEGSLTVALAGAASGAAGALFLALLDWRLSRHRVVRALAFSAFLVFVTLRGLHPVTTLALALFGPLVVVYGVVLERLWHRIAVQRVRSEIGLAA